MELDERKKVTISLELAASFSEARGATWGGLRNQGNTCYLNSLLQTLFHVPALRSDVLGRPAEPRLLPPRDMPKRAVGGQSGRIALLHSLAHIELNAVDLTWDLVGRFAGHPVPRSFYDDWVRVGLEEAKHFSLLRKRLAASALLFCRLAARTRGG